MSKRFLKRPQRVFYTLLALLSFSVSTLCAQSTSPKEALMLRRLAEYWKDRDYAIVKRQILLFLESNPDTSLSDYLYAMLGDVYFQERNFKQAAETYQQIKNEEISLKTFFNHLQAHFELRNYSFVIERGEQYLKEKNSNSKDQAIKIRYLVAESYFRQALKCSELKEKTSYLKLAKPHYKILVETPYGDRVLFPLAEIHRLLREDQRATALYLSLAEKYPEHRERFLFQAAILQLKEDKKEAGKTFLKVYEMGGKRSKLAAFNRLILLYKNGNYEEFLNFYASVAAAMPQEKATLLEFYQGRAYYYIGDYEQAILPLENFVAVTKNSSKELKTALLLLVNCSRYLKDTALLTRTLNLYKTTFNHDSELPKILLIQAQLCRENGKITEALENLKMILDTYPQYEDIEVVLYDYAFLFSQLEQWTNAQTSFTFFIEKYPRSDRATAAWRHLLNCSIEELKSTSLENGQAAKESFVKTLQRALAQEDILSEQEKEHYVLVMIKCQYELGQYQEAIAKLFNYLATTADSTLLAEAHLLMAVCQQKLNNTSLFIEHGEKALTYNLKTAERKLLHLELYNAYLSRALTSSQEMEKEKLFHRAAENLFASESWKEGEIKSDNNLWLTNHYYQLAKLGEEKNFEKAKLLFYNLLKVHQEEQGVRIESISPYLEAETLKLAHLLELKGQFSEEISLLEALIHKQEENKELSWKLKRRSILELAKAYESNHQYKNSMNAFKFLIKTGQKSPSIITHTAKLHLARLQYHLLNSSEKVADNKEVISILHALKDLQIQKRFSEEPVHLEAALQYAQIRIHCVNDGTNSVENKENCAKNALFFYKRMHEDFYLRGDPIAEEYFHAREKESEKNPIFKAYMRYLDGEVLKNQATLAHLENKVDKAHSYEEEALEIFNTLLSDQETLKPYLLEHVKKSKADLIKSL